MLRLAKAQPVERFPAAAKILAVEIIATASVEIVIAIEWIARVGREAKAVSVTRTGPAISITRVARARGMSVAAVFRDVSIMRGVGLVPTVRGGFFG